MTTGDTEFDLDLLHELLRAGGPCSALELARRLPASPGPAAVAAHIAALERCGCRFEHHPQHGWRLLEAGLGCWADYIEPRHRNRLGHRLTLYRQTESTQARARDRLASDGPAAEHDGEVIVADHQLAGRGRLGRRWFAPPGAALLLTAIVARRSLTDDRIMLAACNALADAVEQLTPLRVGVRWPNDLMIDSAKLAGILVEAQRDAVLIGIGVNVHLDPADLPATDADHPIAATSLAAQGAAVDRLLLLDCLLDRLHHALHRATDAALHDGWRQRSTLLEQRVTVTHDGDEHTGRVVGLDVHHGLQLALDRGAIITLPAATTSLLRVW